MFEITIDKSTKVADFKSCYCRYPFNQTMLEFFRGQVSRYYHKEGEWARCWEVPSSKLQTVIDKASELGYDITINIPNYRDNSVTELPKGFEYKTKPFKHQEEFLLYGLREESFICGDEQGLGKTKEIIDLACALKAQGKIQKALIICCDNSLKWNWAEEVEKHSNEKSFVLGTRYGKQSGKMRVDGNKDRLWDLENLDQHPEFFLITNIETLRYVQKIPVGKKMKNGKQRSVKRYVIADKINELAAQGVLGLIAVDEIHLAKNPNSIQGRALLHINQGLRIPMTGTPVLNAATDTYIPMRLIGLTDEEFGLFKWRYEIKDNMGNFVGWKNMEELHELLSGHMIRRLKKDVFDLPPKIYTNDYVEMSKEQWSIYNEVLDALRKNIDKIRLSHNPLAEMIRLRQATGWTGILSSTIQCSAKLERLGELVAEAASSGAKSIVFSNWTDITQPTRALLQQYNPAYITGEIGDRERQNMIHKFQEDDSCMVIIGSIPAMGRGRTLTAASNVLFLDEPWNRATKEQCEDRAHRIGTTGTVNIRTLMCKGTIDERIHDIVVSKGELADMVVDGKASQRQKDDLIEYLLS